MKSELDALEHEQLQIDNEAAELETKLRRVMDKGELSSVQDGICVLGKAQNYELYPVSEVSKMLPLESFSV